MEKGQLFFFRLPLEVGHFQQDDKSIQWSLKCTRPIQGIVTFSSYSVYKKLVEANSKKVKRVFTGGGSTWPVKWKSMLQNRPGAWHCI